MDYITEKKAWNEKNKKLQTEINDQSLQAMITKHYNDLVAEDLNELEKNDSKALAIKLRNTKVDKNLHKLMQSSKTATSHSISDSEDENPV